MKANQRLSRFIVALNALGRGESSSSAGEGGLLAKVGFGLGWRPLKSAFAFDYAFSPGADAGHSHRLTLGVEFGSAAGRPQ